MLSLDLPALEFSQNLNFKLHKVGLMYNIIHLDSPESW